MIIMWQSMIIKANEKFVDTEWMIDCDFPCEANFWYKINYFNFNVIVQPINWAWFLVAKILGCTLKSWICAADDDVWVCVNNFLEAHNINLEPERCYKLPRAHLPTNSLCYTFNTFYALTLTSL